MSTVTHRDIPDLAARNRRVLRVLLAIIAVLALAAVLVGIFKR